VHSKEKYIFKICHPCVNEKIWHMENRVVESSDVSQFVEEMPEGRGHWITILNMTNDMHEDKKKIVNGNESMELEIELQRKQSSEVNVLKRRGADHLQLRTLKVLANKFFIQERKILNLHFKLTMVQN